MLRNISQLIMPSTPLDASNAAEAFTINAFYGFVTPAFIKIFDIAYDQTLGRALRDSHTFNPDGKATQNYINAFCDYCDKLKLLFSADTVLSEDIPPCSPPQWLAVRQQFIQTVRSGINTRAKEVQRWRDEDASVSFDGLVPWFSEHAAADFKQLASQCAPGISMVCPAY